MSEDKSGKCGGQCCERFCLPFGPEAAKQSYELITGQRVWDTPPSPDVRKWQDLEFWYPHLEYLGEHSWDPEGHVPLEPPGRTVHHWRCTLLDPVSRLCTVYERRPGACRTFPDRGVCRHEGCQAFAPGADGVGVPRGRQDELVQIASKRKGS